MPSGDEAMTGLPIGPMVSPSGRGDPDVARIAHQLGRAELRPDERGRRRRPGRRSPPSPWLDDLGERREIVGDAPGLPIETVRDSLVDEDLHLRGASRRGLVW